MKTPYHFLSFQKSLVLIAITLFSPIWNSA
jgi:hypothetical protein